MKSTPSLPLIEASPRRQSHLQLHRPDEIEPRPLPRVTGKRRTGRVLRPSLLGSPGEVLSLNVTAGCAHQCAFCSARAYPDYPGDDVSLLYADTVDRLKKELAALRQKPRAVLISPSTDPFPPLSEIQTETVRVVEVLAQHQIEAWLMTRGYIRPSALRVLTAYRAHVRITFGLTTMGRRLQRILEPLAAPPRLRVRQIAQLKALGIPVQVSLEPLIPGLTDTRANFVELLEALSRVGVRHVTAGYLFLRPGIRDNLVQALEPHGWAEAVVAAFEDGPFLKGDQLAAARYLPKHQRQRGYASLMALAAGLGMTVSVDGVTNPDFQTPRSAAAKPLPRARLLSLL